jgi:hypothetical protein
VITVLPAVVWLALVVVWVVVGNGLDDRRPAHVGVHRLRRDRRGRAG